MASSLKSRRRSDYAFSLDYRTRWSDNDMYAHMNNANYYTLFDAVVNTYLIRTGALPADPSAATEIGLIVRSGCDYFRPIRFPAMADVCVRVNSVGKSSVRYEIAVFERGGGDEPCAVGEYVHVFVDRATMKPAKTGMSVRMRKSLEGLIVARSGVKDGSGGKKRTVTEPKSKL